MSIFVDFVDLFAAMCLCCHGVIPAVPVTAATLPEHCRPSLELERALRGQPSASVYGAAGVWFAGQKNPECAILAFEAALKLDPQSWETHYNVALQRIQRREYAPASRHLRLALKMKPDFVPARNALGMALMELGELPAAEARAS